MPWKMKDNVIVVDNGNPVWIADDGKEAPINGGEVLGKIVQLSGEAKQHRTEKEAAQLALKPFEGLDPAAARDAIDKVAKIDQGQLIAAGKVDEVKNAITAQFKAQNDQLAAENEKLKTNLKTTAIEAAFGSVKDKFLVSPGTLRSMFGDRFDLDASGKIVAKDSAGNVMKSAKKFGEDMDFEEAFTSIIDQHPDKNAIMRGANHNGTGGTGGGGSGEKRRVTRSEEKALPIPEKVKLMESVRKGEAELVDD